MKLKNGKLLTLAVVVVAVALVTATGAFTTVSAERTASVSVAGDQSALLALDRGVGSDGNPSANAQSYVDFSGGQLTIDMAGDQGASGVNQRADTVVHNLFTISNRGSEPVAVYLTKADTGASDGGDADHVYFFTNSFPDAGDNHPDITPDGHASPGPRNELVAEDNAVILAPGETIEVSMYVDLMDASGDAISFDGGDLLDSVTVHAEADTPGYDPVTISTPENTS